MTITDTRIAPTDIRADIRGSGRRPAPFPHYVASSLLIMLREWSFLAFVVAMPTAMYLFISSIYGDAGAGVTVDGRDEQVHRGRHRDDERQERPLAQHDQKAARDVVRERRGTASGPTDVRADVRRSDAGVGDGHEDSFIDVVRLH